MLAKGSKSHEHTQGNVHTSRDTTRMQQRANANVNILHKLQANPRSHEANLISLPHVILDNRRRMPTVKECQGSLLAKIRHAAAQKASGEARSQNPRPEPQTPKASPNNHKPTHNQARDPNTQTPQNNQKASEGEVGGCEAPG